MSEIPEQTAAVTALLRDSTVAVESNSRGSGFFVADDVIVTCAHVLKDWPAAQPVPLVYRGTALQANIDSSAREVLGVHDLALLRLCGDTRPEGHSCVRLGTAWWPSVPCQTYGYSDLLRDGDPALVRVEGETGGREPLLKLAHGQIRPGMSGSPLLNLHSGDVCGVIRRTRDRISDLGGFAVPVKPLLEWADIRERNIEFHKHDGRWAAAVRRESEAIAPPPDAGLEALASTVRQWLDDYLEQAVVGVPLHLRKETTASHVDAPQRRHLRKAGTVDEVLDPTTPMIEVYREFGESMLILGAPGSGKTTTLIQLARSMVDGRVVPIVLNLSSWTPAVPLSTWVSNETRITYHAPAKHIHRWIGERRLAILFDGLDEVAVEHRLAAVDALNRFLEDTALPSVVCCRSGEYHELPAKLRLSGAIVLLPLTSEQVREYAARTSVSSAALQKAFEADKALLELVDTPLMLNVVLTAYSDMSAVPRIQRSQLPDERRKALFARYASTMFRWRTEGFSRRSPYPPQSVLTLLRNLARKMQQRSETTFLIEKLQPSWLRGTSSWWAYFIASRAILAVAVSAPVAVTLGPTVFPLGGPVRPQLPLFQYVVGMSGILFLAGACVGTFDAVRMRWQIRDSILRVVIRGVLQLLILYGASLHLADGADWLMRVSAFSAHVMFVGFFPAVVLVSLIAKRGVEDEVLIRGRLAWSWKSGLKAFGWTVFAFLSFFVLVFAGNAPMTDWTSWSAATEYGLGMFSMFGVFVGIVVAGFSGWIPAVGTSKGEPNYGIVTTMRGALTTSVRMAIGLVLLLIASCELVSGSGDSLLSWLPFASVLCVALIIWGALWLGMIDVLRHYLIRLFLARERLLPFRLPRFLSYAVDLVFLRRAGGTYFFIHRLVLEYFATLSDSELEQLAADAQRGPESQPHTA